MTSVRMTTLYLRGLALLQILTTGIVFIPREGMAWGYRWLHLGKMPDDVAFLYFIRGAAYVQGAIGVLLWVIASDVVKYRPLVITTGAIYLLSAPILYVIATLTGMPLYWRLMDSGSSLICGGVLLVLCLRSSSTGSIPLPQTAD